MDRAGRRPLLLYPMTAMIVVLAVITAAIKYQVNPPLNRCVARVCRKSARHWLTAAPYQLHADGCGVGHLLCFRCM